MLPLLRLSAFLVLLWTIQLPSQTQISKHAQFCLWLLLATKWNFASARTGHPCILTLFSSIHRRKIACQMPYLMFHQNPCNCIELLPWIFCIHVKECKLSLAPESRFVGSCASAPNKAHVMISWLRWMLKVGPLSCVNYSPVLPCGYRFMNILLVLHLHAVSAISKNGYILVSYCIKRIFKFQLVILIIVQLVDWHKKLTSS